MSRIIILILLMTFDIKWRLKERSNKSSDIFRSHAKKSKINVTCTYPLTKSTSVPIDVYEVDHLSRQRVFSHVLMWFRNILRLILIMTCYRIGEMCSLITLARTLFLVKPRYLIYCIIFPLAQFTALIYLIGETSHTQQKTFFPLLLILLSIFALTLFVLTL